MLRGAIIGVGKIAQTGHLPAFNDERIRNRAEIVAAVDTNPESRRIAAHQFPHLHFYASTEEMLKQEDIDFIDICTTPPSHGELIEAAAQTKLHILCEKPFAASVQEAAHIAGVLRGMHNTLVFMPCHQYRYSVLWQHFRSFLHELAGSGCFVQFDVFRTEADPGLSPDGSVWRLDPTVGGGGILADTGVHYLYLTLWMMGMPLKVTARTHCLAFKGYNVEDTATVMLEFEKSLVEINLTWAADRRANSARVVSKGGSLVYDGESLVTFVENKKEILVVPNASDKSHYVSLYVSVISEFIEKIRSGAASTAQIDEAYQSARLLHACYTSAKTGQTVTLDGES